jgi:hypothetical protein
MQMPSHFGWIVELVGVGCFCEVVVKPFVCEKIGGLHLLFSFYIRVIGYRIGVERIELISQTIQHFDDWRHFVLFAIYREVLVKFSHQCMFEPITCELLVGIEQLV